MFADCFRGKRVLITGHTGFKGSWLLVWLKHLGAEVFGYSDNVPTQPSHFELAQLGGRVHHIVGDIAETQKVLNILNEIQPDFVFHLAAQAIVSKSYASPLDTIQTNVIGTANVLEALRIMHRECVGVIVTSDKCYENVEWVWGYRENDQLGGRDVYSGSKGASEVIFHSYARSYLEHFEKHNVRVASARAGNVIGGGDWALDRIIADCIRAWQAGKPVEIRSPNATRPWQHVLEPLSGYLRLAQSLASGGPGKNQSYNFGPKPQQNLTVIELILRLGKIWGHNAPEDTYKITGNVPFHEASLLKLNCDKALIDLSWEPTLNIAECISLTGDWYRTVLRDELDAFEQTQRQIEYYEAAATNQRQAWTQ